MSARLDYRALVARAWSEAAPGTGPDPAHDLNHLARVWANARQIGLDEPELDWQVLEAAVWFHDLICLPKTAPNRAEASRLSAARAVPLLREAGFAEAKLALVAHAIEAHSFSAGIPPETPEAKVLQDADRLEALGAVGIARMFIVAGQNGTGLADATDPMALSRPLDDRRFALDHMETKLLRLPETMQTRMGRIMAEERAEWMMSFRTRLLSELG